MNQEVLSGLLEAALQLPKEPGVYFMHDRSEDIIYIGKAKNLRNRVSSYFRQVEKHLPKVYRMVEQVRRFHFLVTASEFEALVLEASMIKEHHPKYNILLKDDKGYSYFLLTPPPYSRIRHVFASNREEGELLGPYMSSFVVSQTLEEAQRVFQLPTCNRKFPADFRKGRPCLNFYIKRCMGVCQGNISQERYDEIFRQAVSYIRHGGEKSIEVLSQQMEECAQREQFEKAAVLRDRIRAIQRVSESQKVVLESVQNQDVVAFVRGEDAICCAVLVFRGGRLADSVVHQFDFMDDLSELRTEFLLQFYQPGQSFPPLIVLDEEPANMSDLERLLCDRAGHRVQVKIPQRGQQVQLVSMARTNAAEHLVWEKKGTGRTAAALDALATAFGLAHPPVYMESYDISNIGGDVVVGAMVVYENGQPLRKNYRRFRMPDLSAPDDYGAMREMLRRRLLRLLEGHPELANANVSPAHTAASPNAAEMPFSFVEAHDPGRIQSPQSRSSLHSDATPPSGQQTHHLHLPDKPMDNSPDLENVQKPTRVQKDNDHLTDAFHRIPDVLLIDGGQTHVEAVRQVLLTLGLSIPVFGLVKDSRHRTRAVSTTGGELSLSPTSQAFLLLTEIQDETHRCAITYARKKHGKQSLALSLTQCPGIGEITAKSLISHFKTKKALMEASLQDLENAPRIGKKSAARLYAFLHDTSSQISPPTVSFTP